MREAQGKRPHESDKLNVVFPRPTSGPRSQLSLQDMQKQMQLFVYSKGWTKESSARPQTARNLAISLSLEAAELLECFQWRETTPTPQVESELADVLLYAAQLANVLSIDLEQAVLGKLEVNRYRTWEDE